MTSEKLRKARQYEMVFGDKISSEKRPEFHLSPRIGWMNDPNGFSFYNGKYHMFYQYYPYNTQWGPMHWGHAISEDLLHWEYLPAALAPDEEFDKNGCFSGSAVTLDDGRQLLIYTGVTREKQPDGKIKDIQTQCLAVGDGVDYVKCTNNPVLSEKDLPQGASKFDFRDPKAWKKEDGTYVCVIGNRPADGSGQILLYSSQDGFDWKFEKVLIENKCRYGKMWECPDFFTLDGKGVLLISPQDMLPQDYEYHSGNGKVCVIGTFDAETNDFIEEGNHAIDYGIDFYAPQTVAAPDGRRIMIGWMQNWETVCHKDEALPWFGQTSIPREIRICNHRLYQKPIEELNAWRKNKVVYKDIVVNEEIQLFGVSGRIIDMEVELTPKHLQNMYRKFTICIAKNNQVHTDISFFPEQSILEMDRSFSGTRRDTVHRRQCKVKDRDGKIKLRIILDRYSTEVFVNDGEQVMTMVLYVEDGAEAITFSAEGSVKMDVIKYDLMK